MANGTDDEEQSTEHPRGWRAFSQQSDTTREHVADQDDVHPVEHDGRAPTRTGFNPNEFDDTTAWQRRNRWQDGEREDGHKARVNAADRRRLVTTFASQLGLGKMSQARGQHIADQADGTDFGTRTEEVIALGIVSYIAREAGWHTPEDSEVFQNLLTDLDTDRTELREVRKTLRATTDL